MRPEDKISIEEDRGRRAEEQPAKVDTWVVLEAPSREESIRSITEELFGDALNKLSALMAKDKKKLNKMLRK